MALASSFIRFNNPKRCPDFHLLLQKRLLKVRVIIHFKIEEHIYIYIERERERERELERELKRERE